jgi:GNAT superfamily N-acetyltransferase
MIALAASTPHLRPVAVPVTPSLRRVFAGDARTLWSLCQEAAAASPLAPEMPLPLREALFDTPCRSWAWQAEIGGEALGVIVASGGLALPLGGYCLTVDAVYVRPAWRGRGIGTRLHAHARAMAAEMGCQQLRLSDGRVLPAVAPEHEALS